MKKILSMLTAACLLGSLAFAQSPLNRDSKPLIKAENKPTKSPNTQDLGKAGTFTQEWYSVENLFKVSPVSGSLTNYVSFLLYDTLAKRINTDGVLSHGFYVGVGHIFDPKDELIQLSTGQPDPNNYLSKFNSYHIDSLALNYLYVRNADSINNGAGKIAVVDTLFVAYYKGSQISQNKFSDNNINYASLSNKWDYSKRIQTGFFKMDTFLLGKGKAGSDIFDTTRASNTNGAFENGWQSKIATWATPAGLGITANTNGTTKDNLTGFLLVFKSGILPVVNGDTAVFNYQLNPSTLPPNTRRTNYFGYGFLSSSAKYTGYKDHNTSQIMTGASSYASVNGWTGPIAGSAFLNSEQYLNSFFHLQVDPPIPAGMNEKDGDVKISSIFPNPAKNSATVAFGIKVNTNVKLTVYNLVGQAVKTIDFGKVSVGNYEFPVELNNLNAGIYMVSITAGNTTQTQKLVIAE